jgi:hypothetical protein
MSRSLQGLIFWGLALFSLKWSFYGSHDKPVSVTEEGEKLYPSTLFWKAYNPWGDVRPVLTEFGVLAVVGAYVWLTGEVSWWRGRGRHSQATFLSAAAAFLALFSLKWAYHYGGPGGYYPPFAKETLAGTYAAFVVLSMYYLIVGEVQFWRCRSTQS